MDSLVKQKMHGHFGDHVAVGERTYEPILCCRAVLINQNAHCRLENRGLPAQSHQGRTSWLQSPWVLRPRRQRGGLVRSRAAAARAYSVRSGQRRPLVASRVLQDARTVSRSPAEPAGTWYHSVDHWIHSHHVIMPLACACQDVHIGGCLPSLHIKHTADICTKAFKALPVHVSIPSRLPSLPCASAPTHHRPSIPPLPPARQTISSIKDSNRALSWTVHKSTNGPNIFATSAVLDTFGCRGENAHWQPSGLSGRPFCVPLASAGAPPQSPGAAVPLCSCAPTAPHPASTLDDPLYQEHSTRHSDELAVGAPSQKDHMPILDSILN
jgi:hypothetical protein